MTSEPPPWVRTALSEPRFAAYQRAAGRDSDVAVRLYWWNVEISAAFYGSLHCLESSLRNSLHARLTTRYGRADWWAAGLLTDDGSRKVAEARDKLLRRGASRTSADDIVAGLSFGFWVSLLSRGAAYDRKLWVPTLHRAFPGYSGRRETLHDNLLAMVLFRNRIMHHEPIHHRDLAADHSKIYRLLGYISPDMATEVQALDRVPEVLARRVDVCRGRYPTRF